MNITRKILGSLTVGFIGTCFVLVFFFLLGAFIEWDWNFLSTMNYDNGMLIRVIVLLYILDSVIAYFIFFHDD